MATKVEEMAFKLILIKLESGIKLLEDLADREILEDQWQDCIDSGIAEIKCVSGLIGDMFETQTVKKPEELF